MLIVLEGPDGVGKTTLSDLLSLLLDAEVIHSTKETPNDWEYFCHIMEEARYRNIIADRFFWGQFVYQDPEERNLSWDELHQLERRLRKDGGRLIYVTAPEEVIEKRLKARGEIPMHPVKELLEGFQLAACNCCEFGCPVITYDTHNGKVVNNECDCI